MEVTAKYSDNSTKVVTNFTYKTPQTGLALTDREIVITYQEGNVKRTAVQAINVVNRELVGIEITTEPTKVRYAIGETFDPAGMVVTAEYNDGSKKAVTNYTYSPTGALAEANNVITISYTEGTITKTTTQRITVSNEPENEPSLAEIEITTEPTKKTYTEGENFNVAGMVITAKYDNHTSQIVTNYTYEPQTALSVHDTEIIISYTEKGVTKTAKQRIEVKAKAQEEVTLEKIEITTEPTKTTYTEGEVFDKAGMVVTAAYSDGTKKAVSNYTVFPVTALTTNNTSIKVTYTERGITKEAVQAITVNSRNRRKYTKSTINTKSIF